MSYFQRPSSGTSITLPLAVAEGGTGATTPSQGMINLSSPAFDVSASSPDWGQLPVPAPAVPDANENFVAITELLTTLRTLGVIQ